jgi:hypothetical protein
MKTGDHHELNHDCQPAEKPDHQMQVIHSKAEKGKRKLKA